MRPYIETVRGPSIAVVDLGWFAKKTLDVGQFFRFISVVFHSL
jgi:hypothetical protein